MGDFRDEVLFGVLILIVMDNGLLLKSWVDLEMKDSVLILIVMDNGLLREVYLGFSLPVAVLILIVMDNGLLRALRWWNTHRRTGLNPYCNG